MEKKINNEISDMFCDYANSLLLKQKGFDVPSLTYYIDQSWGVSWLSVPHTQNRLSEGMFTEDNEITVDAKNKMCLAPTINVARKWIEVNFGYFIEVNKIFTQKEPEKKQSNFNFFYTYLVYYSEQSKTEAIIKIIEEDTQPAYVNEYDAYNIAIKSILGKI